MSFQKQIKQNVLAIREAAHAFLTDTCTIRRRIGETVINGESIPLFANSISSSCRFIVRSGSESINLASQERAIKQSVWTGLYRMQLPFGTDISVGDYIDFEDIALQKTRTFSVTFVPPFHNLMGAFIVFIQEEI